MKIFKKLLSLIPIAGFGLLVASAFVDPNLSQTFIYVGLGCVFVGVAVFYLSRVIYGFIAAKEFVKTGVDIVKSRSENKQAKIINQQKQDEYVSKTTVCPYCNTTYQGDTDCPNCGGERKD